MLGQIKEAMMSALQQDTAAISAQRCISLYLERLGCVPEASSQRLKVCDGSGFVLVESIWDHTAEAHVFLAHSWLALQ